MGYVDNVLEQPPKGEWVSAKEKVGHLLAIFGNYGIEEQPDNMNPGKTRLVASIDYVDLDDGHGGRIVWGANVDKPGIVNKLKNQRGTILGRLILGDAKVGQSAPYILADHTPEDAAYFTGTWMPANRDALAGKQAQRPPAPVRAPVPAAQPLISPDPAQPWLVPASAAPQPPPQPAPAHPTPAPTAPPVAAAMPAATAAPGMPGEYPPEALAAIQRMMATGQIPAFPPATH